MRHPVRKIWLYIGLSLAGIVMMFPVIWLGPEGMAWPIGVIAIAGLLLFMFSAVWLVTALLYARGHAKLVQGVDVLARWTVTPDEWERFCAFDRIRAGSSSGLVNDLARSELGQRKLGELGQGKTVEVLIGRKSALIGDSYHVLRKRGFPALKTIYWLPAPADPECLEFHISYPKGRYGSVPMTLRFPVPARYRAEGVKVFDHFAPGFKPRPARPGATIVVSLSLASIGALALAWGIHQFRSGDNSIWPSLIAVIGAGIGLGALLVAIATLIATRGRTDEREVSGARNKE